MQLHARHLLLPVLLLSSPAVAAAQRPVRPYEPAPAYHTFNLSAQLTGGVDEGRDLLISWGWLRTGGPSGAWMPRLELGGGLTTGAQLVDRVLAAPQATVGYAFPGQYMSLGRESRGEPYLVASAGAYGIADVVDETRFGVAPSVSAGIGVRVFSDEWNVEMGTFELVVERRFGFEESTELYLRFGRARPARERAEEPDTSPVGLARPGTRRRN